MKKPPATMIGNSNVTKDHCTGTGRTIATAACTKRILKILLPITLPITISGYPRIAAMMEVDSSGSEVPTATIESAMTHSETPKASDMLVADSTSK